MEARVSIQFHVDGVPRGQPRPRAFTRKIGGKFVARVYDCASAEGWKSAIAAAAMPHRPQVPLTGPIFLRIMLYFPRPKRLMRRCDPDGIVRHTGKPDFDNAAKCVADALTQIGMWADDAVISDAAVYKRFHAKAGRPGADISIVQIDEHLGEETAELFEPQVAAGGVEGRQRPRETLRVASN